MKKVLLLSMPFGELELPTLGPCLLKAGLAAAGIECDIRYLGLEFYKRYFPAGEEGLSYHRQLLTGSSLFFLGEWIFASHLFPDACNEPPLSSLDVHPGSKHASRVRERDRAVTFCLELREKAAAFIVDCLAEVPWHEYGVVGFSSSFNQNSASLALATRVKQAHPEVVTILGGPNAEGAMGQALLRCFPQLDYVCSGEGDHVLPAFAAAVLSGKPVPKLHGLLGREWPRPDGGPPPLNDLNALQPPDFTDFMLQSERLGLSELFPRVLPLEASRGCWWGEIQHCTFCALNGERMAFRSKDPRRVLSELESVSKRFSTRAFVFTDNILDTRYYRDLLPAIAREQPGLDLFFEVKAPISAARMRLLEAAGVRHVQPGIESLSTHVLGLMRKGTTLLRNVEALKNCLGAGVHATWSHLYGFPRETLQDYVEVLQLLPSLHHLQPPNSLNRIVLERFSPFFRTPEALGMRNVRPHPAYSSIYPFADEQLAQLAYFFESDYEAGRDPKLDEFIKGPLSEGIRLWQECHSAGARLVAHPELESTVILDTRSGARQVWLLGSFESALLRELGAPAKLASLNRRMAGQQSPLAALEGLLGAAFGALSAGAGTALTIAPNVAGRAAELERMGHAVEVLALPWPGEAGLDAALRDTLARFERHRLIITENGSCLALPDLFQPSEEDQPAGDELSMASDDAQRSSDGEVATIISADRLRRSG